MQPLRSVLQALAERPDVAGAVVTSDDGLVVESSLPHTRDPDELAALATAVARSVETLSGSAGTAQPRQIVVDGDQGALVLQRLPTGGMLLVLTPSDADIGGLLYDLRRHAPALESLL